MREPTLHDVTTEPSLYLSRNLAAVLPIIVLLFLAFALLFSRRRNASSAAKTVVLIGPMGSGKTTLWSRLTLGLTLPTLTSAEENEGHVRRRIDVATSEELIAGRAGNWPAHLQLRVPIHLLDIPGHPRLRTRKLALSLPAAAGIVLTTTTDLRSTREAADHLLLLFALLSLRQARNHKVKMPKLLILLTKTDLLPQTTPTERAISRVRNALEREFERRKADAAVASSARLEGLEAPTTSTNSLAGLFRAGPKGQHLPVDEVELLNSEVAAEVPDWDALGVQLSWASISSTTQAGIGDLWTWIDGLS